MKGRLLFVLAAVLVLSHSTLSHAAREVAFARVRQLGFSGWKCTCNFNAQVTTGSSDIVTITASCTASADSIPNDVCNCFGNQLLVRCNPGVTTTATIQPTVAYPALCPSPANDLANPPCQGNPCTMQGYQLFTQSVITPPVVSANGQTTQYVCSQVQSKYINTCTTNAPCDCVLSSNYTYGPCSMSCGTEGVRSQIFQVITPAINGGACPSVVQVPCDTRPPCPIDCVQTWTSSPCSTLCGPGNITQTPVIQVQAQNGGQPCITTPRYVPCQGTQCPVPCLWSSNFTAAGDCSVSCGIGTQLFVAPLLPGQLDTCTGSQPTQMQPCDAGPCPSNTCAFSDWGNWSACSASCGPGSSTHTRQVTYQPTGQDPCGPTSETVQCNLGVCPADCVMSPWSAWTPCSATCGTGTQQQTRTVLSPAVGTGQPCGNTTNTQTCSGPPCACTYGPWSSWGLCSIGCGGGTQTSTRLADSPTVGNEVCNDTVQTQACNTQPCPVPCIMGDWGNWTTCSQFCGGGTQSRARSIAQQPANGGTPCGPTTQTQTCNTSPCPNVCQVSKWGPWGPCSAPCGGGQRTRNRTVTVQPTNGAGECPPLQQTKPCNTQVCPTKCVVSKWSKWSPCYPPCGPGTQNRTRTILIQPALIECPSLIKQRSCNAGPCPADCVYGDFGPWGPCKLRCDARDGKSGERMREKYLSPVSMATWQCPPKITQYENCHVKTPPRTVTPALGSNTIISSSLLSVEEAEQPDSYAHCRKHQLRRKTQNRRRTTIPLEPVVYELQQFAP